MPTNLHTTELIKKLKTIKDEQHLSVQQIYDMLETAGYHVSINSIKKVFCEGSDPSWMTWHKTYTFHEPEGFGKFIFE